MKKQSDNAPAKKARSPSIRVDTVKIDRLINLVGELVITQSMLSDLGSRFEMSQLPVLLERVARVRRSCACAHSNVLGEDCRQAGSCRHEAGLKKSSILAKPAETKQPVGVAAGNGHDRHKQDDDFEEF